MSSRDAAGLIERMEAHLPHETLAALQACRELCRTAGLQLYLVGGAVRDLLLERPNLDLDLGIEGDTAPVAEALAAKSGARLTLHARFGTASLKGAGFQLDLARARSERYEHPGALPIVEPASLAHDLARRDFSVNAMALDLVTPRLIDPHGGQADLAAKLLRVLHEASFRDDATRALRAVRYAARLGFALEAQTEAWLRRDLRYVEPVSGPRLRRELTLLFEETTAPEGALLASRLGLLAAVHPALQLDAALAGRWGEALQSNRFAPLDELGSCLIATPADDEALASLSARLHLAGRFESALRDASRLRDAWPKLASLRQDAVAAVEALEHYAVAAVWAEALRRPGEASDTCLAYLREWRHIRTRLNGRDVIELGVASGVAVGEALRTLRRARLAGRAPTRRDEEELIRDMLREQEKR